MKKHILFFGTLLFLLSCSTEVEISDVVIGENPLEIATPHFYENKEFGFSLEYPKTWEVSEGSLRNIINVLTPHDSTDNFQEMINVVVGPSADKTLEKFFELNEKIILNSFEELIQLDNAKVIKINGVDFKTVKYNYTFSGYKLTAKIYVALKGDFSYILNCSALQNTFPQFEKNFEKIVHSIKLN